MRSLYVMKVPNSACVTFFKSTSVALCSLVALLVPNEYEHCLVAAVKTYPSC
jgi:hypothetical protein